MEESMNQGSNDVVLNVTQFRLSADIPVEQRAEFAQFQQLFSKLLPLANIEREDMINMHILFDLIVGCYNHGYWELARRFQAEMNMKLQGSRGIKGFETLYGQQGVNRTESIERIQGATRQKSHGIRALFGMDKNKNKENIEEGDL